MRRKKGSRVGTLLFVIPILLVVALIAYAILSNSVSQTGTLIVEAESSNTYYNAQNLAVSVTVNSQSSSQTGTTPLTLSFAPGYCNVTYSHQPWYSTPASRIVSILGGKTSYAVGVYNPIVRFISVAGGEFNQTRITAKHGVTPIVWINPSAEDQFISSQLTGRIEILPMQNYTYVFQESGTFTFFFPLVNSTNLQVSVS